MLHFATDRLRRHDGYSVAMRGIWGVRPRFRDFWRRMISNTFHTNERETVGGGGLGFRRAVRRNPHFVWPTPSDHSRPISKPIRVFHAHR